jgi:phosphosulfolactate phosphohydrolase-like enzyme
MKLELSTAKKNALLRGLIAGLFSLTIYLLIVVVTTPNLSPLASLSAAFRANWIIIVGLSAGVGSQIYLASYGKSLACKTSTQKQSIVGSSGGTAISSFFSFFSLVPLGC